MVKGDGTTRHGIVDRLKVGIQPSLPLGLEELFLVHGKTLQGALHGVYLCLGDHHGEDFCKGPLCHTAKARDIAQYLSGIRNRN